MSLNNLPMPDDGDLEAVQRAAREVQSLSPEIVSAVGVLDRWTPYARWLMLTASGLYKPEQPFSFSPAPQPRVIPALAGMIAERDQMIAERDETIAILRKEIYLMTLAEALKWGTPYDPDPDDFLFSEREGPEPE